MGTGFELMCTGTSSIHDPYGEYDGTDASQALTLSKRCRFPLHCPPSYNILGTQDDILPYRSITWNL
jgi:hypothetical protein